MNNLINLYPNTNFSELNLDYIITLVRQNAGLHLELSGNQLLLKTLDGSTVSSVTVAYATEAGHAQTATNATNSTYATTANTATNATNATKASHALTADSATTAGSATTATSATTAGTATEAVHATTADTATNATNATHASEADYATTTGNVEKAGNGLKAVTTSTQGNIIFTLENTGFIMSDIKKALSADKDANGNVINTTYVANVVEDNGSLIFKNASGGTIATLTPTVTSAVNDSYGNTIANFIKAITAPSDSNYVTVTHGTGTAETLTVNYSNKAWKDTNGNVIKNFYIGSMEIVQDNDTGHYCLVCYNGDTPKAELFRIEINAYSAQIADHATTATDADNAGYAVTAGSAEVADLAEKSEDSAYFIDCYDNHDGDYSIANPNTITIEHVYDNNGNEVDLSSITSDIYHNVYFRYRPDVNATEVYTYTVDTSYKVGSPNSPVFYKARIIDDIDRTSGVDSITYMNIEVGILNGTVATSKLFVYTEDMTSKIIQAEIKTTDTSPLNLTVGQSFDYETDIDASEFIYWILQGNTVMVRFHDEDNNSQGCYLLQNGGPVIMFAYEMGVGPAYFQVTNNNTYTNGLKLIRM